MKILSGSAFACAALLAAGSAIAASDSFVVDCEEFKQSNGIEGDCECMAEKAEEAGVEKELESTTTLEDLEGLSGAAKAVVDACT